MAYYTAAALRERIPALARANTDLVDELIAEFEGLIEDDRGVAYTEREHEHTANVVSTLVLPHVLVTEITDVTQDDVVWTSEQIADLEPDLGSGTIPWPSPGRVTITYTHGYADDHAQSLGARRACREFVRRKVEVETSTRTRGASEVQDDSGTTWTYGTTSPTGVPEADKIIAGLILHRRPLV